MENKVSYICRDKLDRLTLKQKHSLVKLRMKNQNYSFNDFGFERIKNVKIVKNSSGENVIEYWVQTKRFADEKYYFTFHRFYLNEIDLILSF